MSSASGEAGAASEVLHPRPPTPRPPAPSPKARNELALRLLSAAVIVPPLLYVIVHGGLAYLIAVIAIVVLALREFYQLIEAKGARPQVSFGLVAAALLPVVAYVGNEYHVTILMTAALLLVMLGQLGKAEIGQALSSISGTFFGIFYVGWLLAHAVVLRFFHAVAAAKWGPEAAAHLPEDVGVFYMIFVLATVVLCDAGAYFAGRRWGRRKLAPKVSPGKTVEGALGGVAVGALGALATRGVFALFWPRLVVGFGWRLALALGLLLAVVGILGDLVESLLKRDAERKDTGGLLPGMGGILDRIDSNLLAIPVMYYVLLAYNTLRVE